MSLTDSALKVRKHEIIIQALAHEELERYQRKQEETTGYSNWQYAMRTRKTRSTFYFQMGIKKLETESKYGSKVNLRMVYVTQGLPSMNFASDKSYLHDFQGTLFPDLFSGPKEDFY